MLQWLRALWEAVKAIANLMQLEGYTELEIELELETCKDGCRYASDVSMPEHSCGGAYCHHYEEANGNS